MKTVLTWLTPEMARQMLQANTDNRVLRPGAVATLRGAWERGEWKIIHTGIAFGKSGLLLDGQHRLHMIAGLPEESRVPINVTTEMDEEAYMAIDQGNRRTASDIFNVPSGLSAVARFLASMGVKGAAVTMSRLKPYLEYAATEYTTLTKYCPRAVLVWSSAPVRSAAILQMKRGHDADFICEAYRSLVYADIDAMPYAARALMQQRMSGKIVRARSTDLFARSLRVFDSRRTGKMDKIQIKDLATVMAEARTFVETDMAKKSPTRAGRTVAKPDANSTAARAPR